MTPESAPTPPTRVWLPVPAKQVLYTLSTDHYPWSEVWHDLSQRPGFTGVLEARSGNRRAQALWIKGQFVGAYGTRSDKTLEQFSRSFPRALLRLYEADPQTIALAWQGRSQTPQPLPQPWPQAGAALASGGFSGALLGGENLEAVSYWQGGKPLVGTPPPAGQVAIVGTLTPLSAGKLAEFWNQALAQAASQEPALPRAWEASAKALVNRHPCLDPFIHEVWLEGGRIQVAEVDVQELRPALRDVFVAAAQSVRFPLAALKDSALGQHPLWQASGLGAAVTGKAGEGL